MKKDEFVIEVDGWSLTVEYIYEKGEDEIRYYPDGSGHPGAPSTAHIYHVWANLLDENDNIVRVDVYKLLETCGALGEDELITKLVDYHEQ